jgi:hypothetical protein
MASGDTLIQWSALANEPPSSDYATFDTRNQHPVLDFAPSGSNDEEAVFSGVLPRHYAGGGFTVYVHYSMSTAIANTVVWQVAIERVGDQQLDVDGDSFAAFQSSGAVTVPGTSGFVDIASVVLTDGAQIDSVAVGEKFRIKIRRDADDTSATDDATGDAELHLVEIKET